MPWSRTVFAELMTHVSPRTFQTCVARYGGDYKTSRFSCWDQYLCMAFAQLTYRESLRDIEACLRAVQPRLYHMGIRARISRSTLADANETRDWRIYADFAQSLIRTARALYINEPLALDSARERIERHSPPPLPDKSNMASDVDTTLVFMSML